MTMRVPLPSSIAEHAHRGSADPAVPRDAATVVLLRDGADGVEAYLMRRQRSMSFAAGMYVFPGGGVDPRDSDTDVAWAGPEPEAWAERLGCSTELARALVCAAVRETYEEAGVLLAGPDADTVVDDTSGADWQADREALEAHTLAFSDFLERRALVLRTDLLAAWTHWITPDFEPKRFDTRFFVAVMPQGQRVGTLTGEADHASWMPLGAALASVDAGDMAMLPPTAITCRELSELSAAADALDVAAHRRIVPVLPRLVEVDGDLYLETELP
ncbi:NUDIX domain-containing protein [Mumia sp. zg.B53]|uniref:NUDIX hydrolase n=1 Tax=unclassified Mumia TaxID=2621872 RepID=UPI001C6EBFBC|nr:MULTISPECIES: NUDIX domain-containing protein [unclassified Mumia]MBW9207435.1 NUDIX domain-containing protein [Mumia sp. zg.B17]MBW9214834.1 NUDIX domain-containing protein [Mumia sp. zg.B53]